MKKYIFLIIVFSIGSFGQVFGCQTFCENCKITQIEPHITGNTLITFDSRTNDNPDNCGTVSRVMVTGGTEAERALFSSMLSASISNKQFAKVRTCGCKEEWGGLYPKVAWAKINL